MGSLNIQKSSYQDRVFNKTVQAQKDYIRSVAKASDCVNKLQLNQYE